MPQNLLLTKLNKWCNNVIYFWFNLIECFSIKLMLNNLINQQRFKKNDNNYIYNGRRNCMENYRQVF